MTEPSFETTQLHLWLERMRLGDKAAADALLRRVYDRLQVLTRQMLRKIPNVRRWAETDEVYHASLNGKSHTVHLLNEPWARENQD